MTTDSRSPVTSLSSAFRACALPFVASRLLILVAAFFLQYLLDSGRAIKYDYIGDAPLSTLSATFDANWYNSIAEQGYSTSADVAQQQNYHFFPLFPFLVSVAAKLTTLDHVQGGYALAGVILSHLLLLAALMLLYYVTLSMSRDETVAKRSVWLMSILPWAFVFSMTYTEALFLLVSLAAATAAYRFAARPSPVLALLGSLLSVLAALTRPQGIVVSLLVMALVAIVPRGLSLAKRIAYAALAVIPTAVAVASFILYTGWRTGNVWAVLQNNRTWGNGWLADLPRIFTLPPANPLWFIDIYATIGLVAWLALLALLTSQFIKSRRTKSEAPEHPATGTWVPWPFLAYAWVYFLFTALNSPSNNSWGRYLLVIFPCTWALAMVTGTSTPRQFSRLIVGGLTLQALFFAGAILQQATP
ncbi:MAG TPA: mannosyltransferase family protein [Chloroflexia bacterium]